MSAPALKVPAPLEQGSAAGRLTSNRSARRSGCRAGIDIVWPAQHENPLESPLMILSGYVSCHTDTSGWGLYAALDCHTVIVIKNYLINNELRSKSYENHHHVVPGKPHGFDSMQ